MPTLVEIAKHEAERGGIVLFDSSANSLESFTEYMYGKKKYSDFKKDRLASALQSMKEVLDFVRETNTFTVKEALGDFEELFRIIAINQAFLNQHQKEIPKRYSKDRGKTQHLLFKDISDIAFNLSKSLKSKLFKPKKEEIYNLLYDKIPDLFPFRTSLTLPLKYRKLYAAALYLSLYKKTPTALVVNVRDFLDGMASLIKKFPIEIEKDFQAPNSQQYPIRLYVKFEKQGLYQSPITLYTKFPKQEGYELIYPTRK